MEALITLYTRKTGIEAEKLQMIEDIETYLSTKEATAPIYTIQYQKIKLNMNVKIVLNEQYSSPLKADNYTYVKITNKDNLTKHFYFFVKSLNWKSQECIELDLVMDTLNSFKMGVDYTFSPKTIIQRQHKDRMEYKETTTYSLEEIEITSVEQYENNKFYKFDKTKFTTGAIQFNFGNIVYDSSFAYLYVYDSATDTLMSYPEYKGWTQTNEIKFNKIIHNYIGADEWIDFYFDDNLVLQQFYPEDLPSDISIVFLSGSNPYINNDQSETLLFLSWIDGEVLVDAQKFGLRKIDLLSEELGPILYGDKSSKSNLYDSDSHLPTNKWYLLIRKTGDSNYPFGFYFVPEKTIPFSAHISTGYDEGYLTPINAINTQADSIVKIIKLPYLPISIQYSGGKIRIDNTSTTYGLRYFSNLLQPSPVQPTGNFIGFEMTPVSYSGTSSGEDGFYTTSFSEIHNTATQSPIRSLRCDLTGEAIIENRNDNNESKMFHSEFYSPKVVFDSFAFPYQLELVDETAYTLANIRDLWLSFKFVCSRTANSVFAFQFRDYKVKHQLIDYPDWLIAKRNNEELVVNDAYISYLQNGYNYDLKAKQQSNITNWASFGMSAIATIGAGILTYATGGASAPLLLATFAGGISTAKNLTNAISSTITNERNMEQKMEELRRQSANVSGSDDISIMSEYCDNKAFMIIYKVSDRMEKLLKDLFYYYGYKDNITGVPNMSSRIWFNYLKCEPVLDFSSINMTQEIEDELKAIMRSGFTLYHKYNGTWDINQVKENWETTMISHLN